MPVSRTKLTAFAALAFAGGVFFASSMDWTSRLFAQGGVRPAASEGRTLVDASNAFVAISEHITPAVVSVQAERVSRPSARGRMQVPPGFEEFFRQFDGQQPQPRTQESSGSGFIVSKDGYILTNNHVVEDADRLRVAMQDRRIFDARVVGRDPTTDVAVLKIDATDLTAVTFGDDEQLRIGEWVLAVGNPLGLDFTVTAGIVSAKGRGLQGLQRTQYDISDFIQTDAAINPGNSGGPLVNARGEVVGINSAIASQTGFYSGYGFAIPITLAKQVMDDLIAHGEVRRAVIGVSISEVTPEDAAVAGLEEIAGVKVGGYSGEDSPALRAGIEPGDILVKADGKPVDRVSALQRVIRGHKPGDVVAVEAMRYGISTVGMRGTVVIGEGEKDNAPMLYNGEAVGDGTGPECDVAVDPIDGTTLAAKGMANAIAVMAVAPRGSMYDPSAVFYMEKLVTGPEAADVVDIRYPVAENIHQVAKAKGSKPEDVTVVLLDRPRHEKIAEEIRATGARIKFITDGDVAGAIMAARPDTGIDLLLGVGGTPEGIIAACAMKCLDGVIQGRLWPTNDDERQRAIDAGLNVDADHVLRTDELVQGDDVFFVATGITDGELMRGVRYRAGGCSTHSLVMRSRSGTIRSIASDHKLQKLRSYAAVDFER